jgi:hypothetical protein
MSMPTTEAEAICQSCGACCETYRVSFYWAEALERGIADDMVEQLTPWHACLRGTNDLKPRCAALTGKVGERVACGMYAARPSPCREVQVGDDRCRRARQRHGLPDLPAFLWPDDKPAP